MGYQSFKLTWKILSVIKIKLSIKPLLMGEYSWEKKNLPTKAEDARERVQSLGQEDPLE